MADVPSRLDEERVALFLSRVHPKKGLLELVRAWAQVAPEGWRLEIAGPDEGGHWDEVARLVAELHLGDFVRYHGAVEGDRKTALFRRADLFVLPTFSENFGVVVAEALASGVPVITTRSAPWADLESHRCGWWIDVGVEPLAAALRAAMGLSDDERRAMGERGRHYVRRYDWDEIARQTLALYRWLLGHDDRPEFVRVD
jgi:glycosyltransferase involved in cell wall biosynthesis